MIQENNSTIELILTSDLPTQLNFYIRIKRNKSNEM